MGATISALPARTETARGDAGPFEVAASEVNLLSSLVQSLVESMVPGAQVAFTKLSGETRLRSSDVMLSNLANGRILVVFGSAPDGDVVSRLLSTGVHSMISIDATRDDLTAAVESLLGGPAFVSTGVVAALASQPSRDGSQLLTSREREVLHWVAEGLSNQEMATRLCVSPNTVRTHLQSASSKLGVNGRTRLAARARTLGIA